MWGNSKTPAAESADDIRPSLIADEVAVNEPIREISGWAKLRIAREVMSKSIHAAAETTKQGMHAAASTTHSAAEKLKGQITGEGKETIDHGGGVASEATTGDNASSSTVKWPTLSILSTKIDVNKNNKSFPNNRDRMQTNKSTWPALSMLSKDHTNSSKESCDDGKSLLQASSIFGQLGKSKHSNARKDLSQQQESGSGGFFNFGAKTTGADKMDTSDIEKGESVLGEKVGYAARSMGEGAQATSNRLAIATGVKQKERTLGDDVKDGMAEVCPKLSRTQRLYGFASCLSLGVLIAAMGYLSLLANKVPQFAVFYTLGNLVALGATMFFVG